MTNPLRKTRDLRPRLVVLALALIARPAAHALDPTGWQHRQTVTVSETGLTSLLLPPATLDAARLDLGDIRLLDPTGQEVAYTTRQPARPAAAAPAASFRSSLTDTSTQLVIGCGDATVESVTLQSPAREFLKRATLESSADGTAWRVVSEGVPVFRQGGAEQLTLPTTARFVRVTLDDARSAPVAFTGARVNMAAPAKAVRSILPLQGVRREEFAGETVLTLELSAAHVPLNTLTLSTPERLFTRPLKIAVREVRDETAAERTLASGSIYRLAPVGDAAAENLTLPLGFRAPSRELILHVTNADSRPLALDTLTLSSFAVTLQFDAMAPGEYLLLTGNPQAAAPRYDIATLGSRPLERTPLVPGPLLPNPGFAPTEALAGTPLLGGALDPAPWSFRKTVQLAAPGVQQLELDLDVLAHASPGFSDLRLVRAGQQVPFLLERSAVARSLTLPLVPKPDERAPRVSRWEIKLPRAGLPLSRLTFTSPTALFQRHVTVGERISSDRGESFVRALGAVSWQRRPGETVALELTLPTPPLTDTLIVETDNGDNPPLVLEAVTATHPVTRLLFKAEPAPLALYYGNPQALAPRYDLALVAPQLVAATKVVATLAAEEALRSTPWTATALAGRSGLLFWGALGLVVIGLLAVVAKLLPKPKP